jgi:hypothetical protein
MYFVVVPIIFVCRIQQLDGTTIFPTVIQLPADFQHPAVIQHPTSIIFQLSAGSILPAISFIQLSAVFVH